MSWDPDDKEEPGLQRWRNEESEWDEFSRNVIRTLEEPKEGGVVGI